MAVTEKAKEIFSIVNSGKGFINPLSSGTASLVGNIGACSSGLTTLTSNLQKENVATQLQAVGITPEFLAGGVAAIATSTNTTSSLVSYGEKSISEFSQRMQLADGYKSVVESYTELETGCSPFNSVMGIVKGVGQTAVDTYNNVVASVSTVISDLNAAIAAGTAKLQEYAQKAYDKINEFIQEAEAYAKKVVSMIEEEASVIAEYVKAQANAFMAKHMPDWFKDPCKSDITNHIASDTLKSASK